MKDIRINKLTLENFKAHKALSVDFNGRNTDIYGDNATGKTSIYDALVWLLFSKDSHGNGEKNVEIKPLGENGEVLDHNAVTSVEAVLDVDGTALTLKREFYELWSVKRGTGEPTFDGNQSAYYVDGVPVKKYAFSDKVDELVDEDTFRMLTSVSHFADALPWQERRAVLFDAAGVMEDDELMRTDERFIPLLEEKGRLSVDDLKKKLIAEKRGFAGAKNELPARISECEKTIADTSVIDFSSARAEVDRLSFEKDILEGQLITLENDQAVTSKRLEIRETQLMLDALENDNRAHRASQSTGEADEQRLMRELSALNVQLADKGSRRDKYEKSLSGLEAEIAESRERWIKVNGEKFVGGECPTCRQPLPAAMLKSAVDDFEARKKIRLGEIERTASARKQTKAQLLERISELDGEIETITADIERVKGELEALKISRRAVTDIEGYAESKAAISDKLNALSGELADLMTDKAAARGAIEEKIAELKRGIAEQNAILGKESLLKYARQRIEELREDAKKANEKLEGIERTLYLIEEYTRYKTGFVEESVNRLFGITRFRLFREQANGGLEERCDATLDGIPYGSLNSGAKINVGIDIINTLSRIYGVRVPLFIDNAESVTRLEPSDTQTVCLVVSEIDKELRFEYES